jgi:hypothetical protein
VSYSRHDERLVKPIAELVGLSAETVFLDVSSLKPGDDWDRKIKSAIRDSVIFILCWCCQSSRSEYIAAEMKMALRDKTKKLVPVLLCSTALPEGFASKQWIDLRKAFGHHCVGHGKQKKIVRRAAKKRAAKRAPARREAETSGFGMLLPTSNLPPPPPPPPQFDTADASSLARKIRRYFKDFAEQATIRFNP